MDYSGTGWLTMVNETPNNEFVPANNRNCLRSKVGTLLEERPVSETQPWFQATTQAPSDHRYDDVRLFGKNVSIKYDAVGRVTKDENNQYAWNGFDNLTSTQTKVRKHDYVYDAFGRRVGRITPFKKTSSIERFVWAGQRLIQTYRNSTPSKRILQGPGLDQPLIVESNVASASAQVDYPIFDLHGSVRILQRDNLLTPNERYEYDPYGRVRVFNADGDLQCDEATSNGPCLMASEFGYAGAQRDPETGNYYLRNRYYSPQLRIFLSQDPLGHIDSFNPWAYAANDPLTLIDPLGLLTMRCPGYCGFGVGGRLSATGAHSLLGPAATLGGWAKSAALSAANRSWETVAGMPDAGMRMMGTLTGAIDDTAGALLRKTDEGIRSLSTGLTGDENAIYVILPELRVGETVAGGYRAARTFFMGTRAVRAGNSEFVRRQALWAACLMQAHCRTAAARAEFKGAQGFAMADDARFISRTGGEVLDVSRIRVPGPVNSSFGKVDYLLGNVGSVESVGKGGFFRGVLGFSEGTLSPALKRHLIENYGSATVEGSRIRAVGTLVGPGGRPATVQSVWQVTSEGFVDLITAVPR